MTIYLIISLLSLAASVLLLIEHVTINAASAVPLALAALSLLQALIFKSAADADDRADNTAYSLHEIDRTASGLAVRYHMLAKLAVIPLLCVFILYFGSIAKIAAPIAIYILSFLPAPLLVRLKK